MAHLHRSSMESIISLLPCTSDEYWEVYDGPSSTEDLAARAVTIIAECKDGLRAESPHYQLDELLYGMLSEAPHPAGKRHVAAALQLAYASGQTAVVNVAKAWMEKLFIALLACTSAMQKRPRGSCDQTFRKQNAESPIRLLWKVTPSSDLGVQISTREKRCCAIMKILDIFYVDGLARQRNPILPPPRKGLLSIAHIFPFAVDDGLDGQLPRDEPHLWDFFQVWTQMNIQDLSPHKMNSPANAMFVSQVEYNHLTRFKLYFDKAEFPDSPNKYRVKSVYQNLGLSNGKHFIDVEFPSLEESGFEPPDPKLLRVHACFAKVLFNCGATLYYSRLAYVPDADIDPTMDTETGRAFLSYQIAVLGL